MNPTTKQLRTHRNRYILCMRVDATSYEDATQRILDWARTRASCYVCAANVHMTMEVYDKPAFAQIVNNAALVTPDGMPLVWALRALGIKDASRVYGPTLTLYVCKAAAQQNIAIGLYGGTSESLERFTAFLKKQFPRIRIVCQIAPPFRPITLEENSLYTQQIVASGAQILLVGIGCPKQEFWMAAHNHLIPAVMLGVGAAFDFHSGQVKQAPEWMQNIGLEWLFRLIQEPKRLWKRYMYNNPRFVLFFLSQLLTSKLLKRKKKNSA